MPDDDKNWAGKGFSKRNEESAPRPELLRVSPKPEPKDDEDDEEWVWA